MLNLLCPHCLKSVSIPEDLTGKETPCPECGKSLPVPSRYTPFVAPAPVVSHPPSTNNTREQLPVSPMPIAMAESATSLPTGYTRSRGVTISPGVIAWTPAVCLTLILLLTLTPWVGVYPNGHPVYTQGAWRAITGYPKRDIPLEDLLLTELPAPSVSDRTSSDWLIMLPYVLALWLAVAVAWAERVEQERFGSQISRRVPGLWPHRLMLLAGLAGAALLLIALEAARGFGLERAVNAAVAEKFATERKAALTPGDIERVDFRQNLELAKYNLERTGWFCLAIALHVLALLAMLARLALERRGAKPPPRIVIQY